MADPALVCGRAQADVCCSSQPLVPRLMTLSQLVMAREAAGHGGNRAGGKGWKQRLYPAPHRVLGWRQLGERVSVLQPQAKFGSDKRTQASGGLLCLSPLVERAISAIFPDVGFVNKATLLPAVGASQACLQPWQLSRRTRGCG